jgi:membrane-associated phospholipid phosphatase
VGRWLFDFERRILWQRRRRRLVALLLAFLLVLLLDGVLFRAFVVAPVPPRLPADAPALMVAEHQEAMARFESAKKLLEESDFYWTFRIAGTVWPWLLICGAMLAHAVTTRPRPRGLAGASVMILCSAAICGVAAEVTRIATGRLRPNCADVPGTHQFKGLWERFQDPSNLAFPSSHAAVAFGAAFMVAFVFPRAGGIALLAAVGCGITRMAAGAHFASDVFGAAVLGYAVARVLRPGGWTGLRPAPLLP